MEEFDTAAPAHPNWPDDLFARIVDGYLTQTANAGGMVGNSQSYLLAASGLLEFTPAAMLAISNVAQVRRGVEQIQGHAPAREQKFGE